MGICIFKGIQPPIKDISKPVDFSIPLVPNIQNVKPKYQNPFLKSNRYFRYNSYYKNRHNLQRNNHF